MPMVLNELDRRRVRIYGYSQTESSFTQVTRGMSAALAAAGELAGVWPLDEHDNYDDADSVGGQSAPVSLNFGDPAGLLRAHRTGSHRSHWLLLAPNGETLPYGFMDGLLKPSAVLPKGMLTGGLLAPSAWAASVLRRYVPEGFPVIVAPHGVTPEIHKPFAELRTVMRDRYMEDHFTVLHMTSSETERKGTKLLLRAWKELKRRNELPPKAKLVVMMNPQHVSKVKWWCADFGLTEDDVSTETGLTHSQEDIALIYGSVHAVCQPSRGEGFGLVPLEALACGVPVIATNCTGHTEYLGCGQPGVVLVPHGPNAPMDDFPGSMAPSVDQDCIEAALRLCYEDWGKLARSAEENADNLRTEWSWVNKNGPAIRRMLQEAEKHV